MFSLQTEELGRSVHVDEVFQQTHISKSSENFVDDRSRQTHVSFFSTCFKFFSCTLITMITNIFHFNRKIFKVDSLEQYLSHNLRLPQYLLH